MVEAHDAKGRIGLVHAIGRDVIADFGYGVAFGIQRDVVGVAVLRGRFLVRVKHEVEDGLKINRLFRSFVILLVFDVPAAVRVGQNSIFRVADHDLGVFGIAVVERIVLAVEHDAHGGAQVALARELLLNLKQRLALGRVVVHEFNCGAAAAIVRDNLEYAGALILKGDGKGSFCGGFDRVFANGVPFVLRGIVLLSDTIDGAREDAVISKRLARLGALYQLLILTFALDIGIGGVGTACKGIGFGHGVRERVDSRFGILGRISRRNHFLKLGRGVLLRFKRYRLAICYFKVFLGPRAGAIPRRVFGYGRFIRLAIIHLIEREGKAKLIHMRIAACQRELNRRREGAVCLIGIGEGNDNRLVGFTIGAVTDKRVLLVERSGLRRQVSLAGVFVDSRRRPKLTQTIVVKHDFNPVLLQAVRIAHGLSLVFALRNVVFEGAGTISCAVRFLRALKVVLRKRDAAQATNRGIWSRYAIVGILVRIG